MVTVIDLHFLNKERSIAAFAVRDDAGYTLVECGPHSTHDNLLEGLAANGIDAAEVHSLMLSHIHFDHAGAAWWWAEQGATVYVHPYGRKHMIDPGRLYNSARQIYGERMEELWGEMRPIEEDRILSVADRQVVSIAGNDWIAHHTPGHARHHIAWQLGGTVFTGDVGGCRIGSGPVIPPCPPPDIDTVAWKQSIDRLRSLEAEELYLTHFGRVGDIDFHLDDLEGRLGEYVRWMEPHHQAGATVEQVVPEFEAFVKDELRRAGVGNKDLEAYLAANPPYMSVTGLMRWLTIRDRK